MTKTEKKTVQTGVNIMDGQAVYREINIPVAKDYSEGRKLFPIHTSIQGSVNARKMDLVRGESIYLNEDELRIFRNYVNGAGT